MTLSATAAAEETAPTAEAAPEEAPPAASAEATATFGEGSAEASATAAAPEEPPPAPPEPPLVPESEGTVETGSLEGGTAVDAAAAEPTVPAEEERAETVHGVGVERLPGSAYPAVQVRGIKYGSLWRTFHGQQWPVMPMLAGEPAMRLGFSGYVWNDLSNTRLTADESLSGNAVFDQVRWTTQTRGVLRMTPTYNAGDDWFVQGNAELVVQGDQRSDPNVGALGTTDDVFVRVGKWNLFDITVGRFQGWEIANHYGMALDINTLERSGAWMVTASIPKPTDGYGLTYFWDRQNLRLGAYALHLYPTEYLRAEILGHIGEGPGSASTPYQMDIRPSAIFDIGWVKVKAGWEYGKAIPQDTTLKLRDTKNGFGFAAQFVLDPWVELGGSFARGFQDLEDINGVPDLIGSNTVQTFGGFLNASPGIEPLVIGFGAFWNHWENFRINNTPGPHQGETDQNDQRLMYGAVQYTIWEQLYLKLVMAHASNEVADFRTGIPAYTNTALSARFRAEVLF